MSDKDSYDSEEEIIVYAEFEDNVDIKKYKSLHVLGIDTDSPIVQLDDTFFKGKYENPLGTYMCFAEDTSAKSVDQLFDKLPKTSLQYLHKTRKYIKLQHAYITPKKGTEEAKQQEKELQIQDSEIKPASFKNVQEALEFFKKEWSSNEQLE